MRHSKSRLVESRSAWIPILSGRMIYREMLDESAPVRLQTAPTGPDGSGSKPRGESVHLFFEFTINDPEIQIGLFSFRLFNHLGRKAATRESLGQ